MLKAQNDQDAVRMPTKFAKQPGCCQDAVGYEKGVSNLHNFAKGWELRGEGVGGWGGRGWEGCGGEFVKFWGKGPSNLHNSTRKPS